MLVVDTLIVGGGPMADQNELAFSVVAWVGLFLDQTNQQAAWKELLHPIAAELLALVWRQVCHAALWDSNTERHAALISSL